MTNEKVDLNKTADLSVANGSHAILKDPEFICPVHGNIKNKTMKIEDLVNDVELTHCCLHCLADLINKNTPKIELKNG